MSSRVLYESKADNKRYFYLTHDFNNHTPAHFHKSCEIVFVAGGKQRIIVNGNVRDLGMGDIAVSNAFDVHYYECIEKSEIYILLADESFYYRFDELYKARFETFLQKKEGNEQIFGLVEKLFAEQDSLNQLSIYGRVDEILGAMATYYTPKISRNVGNNSVAEILKYIAENYKDDLTLESMSQKFGYSRNHFSKLFNRYTGMHFRDYINKIRIENAKEYMFKNKDVAITKVAFMHGFDSHRTFYRAYNKFGKTEDDGAEK